jgi:RHS repeat-associated protein
MFPDVGTIFFGGARVARRDGSGNIFYYLTDHLGSSREIVQAGHTTPCYDADFYPFGGERKYTDNCPQNYKFTGKERDAESGLDDFEARFYASFTGRFTSPDDAFVGWQLNDPQSLNLYAYVQDNPINDVDPTGHMCETVNGLFNTANPMDCRFTNGDSGLLNMGNEATVDGGFTAMGESVLAQVLRMAIEEAQNKTASGATSNDPPPTGITIASIVQIPCDGNRCYAYGLTVAVTYQLTAGNKPDPAPGYVFQEIIYGGWVALANGQGTFPEQANQTTFENIGPTPHHGNQVASDSSGQFRDAPYSQRAPVPFEGHRLQKLQAIGPDGKKISLGENSVTVRSGKKGSQITIDNPKMKIHVTYNFPP